MPDKLKSILSKVSITLGIIVTTVTIITAMVRNYDLTNQVAETVEKINSRLEVETAERMRMDTLLSEQIRTEREERKADIQVEKESRKDEYTKIQVRLTEIDTTLIYIKQGVDSLRYPSLSNIPKGNIP